MMNCKICGAELKKPGELCNNCMNKLMEEQERRNDKSPFYTFKREFVLGYELMRHLEQIGIVIFMIVLLLSVNLAYWKYALLIAGIFIIFGIGYLINLKIKINSGICTLYRTKLVFQYGNFKKRVKEIPYDEVEEVYYQLGNMQQLFKVGTIVIKKKTRNILDKYLYIESVKNIEKVFGKFEEVFK